MALIASFDTHLNQHIFGRVQRNLGDRLADHHLDRLALLFRHGLRANVLGRLAGAPALDELTQRAL